MPYYDSVEEAEVIYPTVPKNASITADSSIKLQNGSGLRVNKPNGVTEMARFTGAVIIQANGYLLISSNGNMQIVGV